ncbi:MAG: hypothetical protein HGB37_04370 [Candidatus Moranbacteria bacterium]|nr:hypothetical protein [Candidatus Moranbacteria bacterium]NTW90112.1 hypothetical protein [Candidatus Moranbacteria bacterium]
MATYIQDTVGSDDSDELSDQEFVPERSVPISAVHDSSTGEPSVISGYFLLMFGALDDMLDFVSGYFPGVASAVSFIPSTGQAIVVILDPNLRKQASGDAIKLIFKRGALIGVVWLIEGIPIVNLLPLQTVAAFAVRYIKVKQKKLKAQPLVPRR